MPFSRAEFFDVFAAYNGALWPAALVLWLATAVAVGAWWSGRIGERALAGLLTLHWLWAGVAYHGAYFARINPAAQLFAALFVLQAVILAWTGLKGRLSFERGRSPRHHVAAGLVAYALAYPLLAVAAGHPYPRTPSFGVPCPTTLLTAGFLLSVTPPISPAVVAVPILWSGIGGSAAFLLGVAPDLLLPVAGTILLLYTLRPGWIWGRARS